VTIRPGDAWGSAVEPPLDAVVAVDDAGVIEALAAGPVVVRGGDLWRTLGGAGPATPAGSSVLRLPVDLVEVRLDDRPAVLACAHVVATRPWWRGGWLRGPVVAVMNAEFVGDLDVAPRGHPNDGRVEVVVVDRSMSLRDRLGARRRLATATHVPHPDIEVRSQRTARIEFGERLVVRIDGRRAATASRVELTVCADAAAVHL
jgi:hypothetical protein